jgi:hypothetical protein
MTQSMCSNVDGRKSLFTVNLKSNVSALMFPTKKMSWILGQHHVKTVIITDVIPTIGEFSQELSSNINHLYYFNTVLHHMTL